MNVSPEQPISASCLYEKAEAYRTQNQWEEAIALYQKTIELDPNFSWAYHQLGDLFSHQEKWQEAIVAYNQAIACNPNFSWSYNNLGNVFSQLGQWEEAILAYQTAIELNPDFCWSYYRLGNALSQQQRWEEAIFAYFQTFKQQPDLQDIPQRIGETLQRQYSKGLDNLIQIYCSAIQDETSSQSRDWHSFQPQDFELIVQIAQRLMAQNDLWGAIIFYNIAFKIKPNDIQIKEQLETALYRQNQNNQIIQQCRQVVELSPDSEQAYYDLGMALSQQYQWDEAVHAFLNFIKINPNNFLWNHQNIVDILNKKNGLDQAIQLYHQALLEDPKSCLIYLNLSLLMAQKGDLKAAIQYNHLAGQNLIPQFRPNWVKLSEPLEPVNQLDFMIIGTQKGGTTSLHLYLTEHPQIISSMIKEIPFWTEHFHRGLDWYFSHFPPIPKGYSCLVGEATPINFNCPEIAKTIFQFFPNVKLILLLRNPIDRAVSHYHHWLSLKWEWRSFEDAIQSELETLICSQEGYLGRGLYINFLEQWMQVFPREQFLILSSEEFYANPDQKTGEVLQFLGLPEYHLSQYKKYNTRPYPAISQETRSLLQTYYQPYNQQLEDLLGMKFNWD